MMFPAMRLETGRVGYKPNKSNQINEQHPNMESKFIFVWLSSELYLGALYEDTLGSHTVHKLFLCAFFKESSIKGSITWIHQNT